MFEGRRFILVLVLTAVPSVAAQAAPISEDPSVAWVIHDRSTGRVTRSDDALAARRLPPCSTFKIYNTLIGGELGLLPGADEPWYRWDGVRRSMEAWNRDLTLREAFRVSAVPAYQVLARRIGERRMKEYLDRIGYGTRDLSAGIDEFWLDRTGADGVRPIRISADEQVALLDALLDGRLPFSPTNVARLKDIMKYVETAQGTLYGKTGSGMGSDGKWTLGWYVGFVEHGGKVWTFACNITGGEGPSGLKARAFVEERLRTEGLL